MQLNFEQIKSITLGADRVEQVTDGFAFHRMTKSQEQAFFDHREHFLPRAYATTSVRFDFYTNSDYLKIGFCNIKEGTPASFYGFDVFVNGSLVHSHFGNPLKDTDGEFLVELFGDSHVQVFFPNLAIPTIKSVELSDGSTITPFIPKKKLLCFGDSITQGYAAICPSNLYVNIIARRLNADIRNISMASGHFFADAIEKINGFDPDIITVAYGTNDWNGKRELFQPRCEQFMKKLNSLYPDTKVFVILPIWRVDCDEVKELTGDFYSHCDFIKKQAELYGFEVIDGLALVPHDLSLYVDKQLHPNDVGFIHYANNLIKYLK